MNGKILDLKGKETQEIELPETFEETYRPDLIKRAHLAENSSSYQPKGTDSKAGLKNTAEYRGKRGAYLQVRNRGISRLPRQKHYPTHGRIGEVKKVPQAKGGIRAHPPEPEKKIKEKINKKERKKAIKSAIAATAQKETVEKRGHHVNELEFPIIVENQLESLKKTQKISEFLKKLGIEKDLEKARENKKTKQGKGKARGRKYRQRKTALIVPGKDQGIKRAARNIPGVEITLAENLSVNKLAPGGTPGRLTVYTENAIQKLKQGDQDD